MQNFSFYFSKLLRKILRDFDAFEIFIFPEKVLFINMNKVHGFTHHFFVQLLDIVFFFLQLVERG
jgi:hypothetical protein